MRFREVVVISSYFYFRLRTGNTLSVFKSASFGGTKGNSIILTTPDDLINLKLLQPVVYF